MSKLYVLIWKEKHYILQEIVNRWGLTAGMKTVMGYSIKSD